MEELRSTEVLDREILEDARKKAFKILKNADDAVVSQARRWEKKTQKALADIRKTYAQRAGKQKDEILARLPLDKRRLRSETTELFLKEAIADFLAGLSRETLLRVLERELSERLSACTELTELVDSPQPESAGEGEEREIRYSAMSREEAEGILKKALAGLFQEKTGNGGNWEFRKDEGPSASKFPALVLNVPAVRISASVEAAAEELLKEKRAELAAALLGEGVLND